MDLSFSPEELAFRTEVQAFIGKVFPPDAPYVDGHEGNLRWRDALLARGLPAYRWPVEFGGPDWTASQKFIWERETTAVGLPAQVPGMGIALQRLLDN